MGLMRTEEKKVKKINKRIETPRINFTAKIEFETMEEAKNEGWSGGFQHEDIVILTKDNRVGAIIDASKYQWT